MKIILNKCYGGFSVSDEAYELYAKKKGLTLYRYYDDYRNKKMHKGSGLITYYFTKDFGNNVEMDKIDWKAHLYLNDEHRDDPILIEVVEELGKKASDSCANLVIIVL